MESHGQKRETRIAAHLVYRMINKRAFRRERVIHDRTNPLDKYSESDREVSF